MRLVDSKIVVGLWKEESEELLALLENYFSSIFNLTCPSEVDLERAVGCVDSRLSLDDVEWISRPFTGEKVI